MSAMGRERTMAQRWEADGHIGATADRSRSQPRAEPHIHGKRLSVEKQFSALLGEVFENASRCPQRQREGLHRVFASDLLGLGQERMQRQGACPSLMPFADRGRTDGEFDHERVSARSNGI